MIKVTDCSRLKDFGFQEIEGGYSKVVVDEQRDVFNVKHTVTVEVNQNKVVNIYHQWGKDLKDKIEQEHNKHYGYLEHNYINGCDNIPFDTIVELCAAGLLEKVTS